VKNIGKGFVFLAFLSGILLLLPFTAQAANVTRTLQPGRVYEFTGRDARVISLITVSGVGRYQYVAIDNRGDVLSYGFSFGGISVRGNGITQVTPLAPMNVTFNTARLTLQETGGEALRQISLSAGQTLAMENLRNTGLHIRTDQASSYEAVVTHAPSGLPEPPGVAFLDRDIRFPQLNIPAGGEAVITARDGLTVYFPAHWYGSAVRTRRLSHPAIFTHVLNEGEAYAFTFTGESNASLTVEPLFTTMAFSYSFILRDRLGFAVSHGEATGNRITVQPNHILTITPHMNAELIFPHTLRDMLHIGLGTETPAYYTLGAGESLAIRNASPQRPYLVHLTSEPEGYPYVYDFTLETEEGITFSLQSIAGSILVPPGGKLTLTAGSPPPWAPQVLSVRFPENDAITLEAASAAIAQYVLEGGASFIVTNEGEKALSPVLRLSTEGETDTPVALDYVLTDPDGEIAAFGRHFVGEAVTWEPGYSVHYTNPNEDAPVSLFFPLAWHEAGLAIDVTDAPALFRRELEAGEVLRFDNVNTRYNKSLLIENAENNRLASFEYVLTDTRNAILDYGQRATGTFNLRFNSRLTLMPSEEARLYVSFPSVWENAFFRTAAAPEPPLHHIVLQPGEQLSLRNPTTTDFVFSNNSAPAGASYFTRTGEAARQPVRILASEVAVHGPLQLPANTTMVVIAARGADLHIWMPLARARQLRLA
jgi:hypothetical protein